VHRLFETLDLTLPIAQTFPEQLLGIEDTLRCLAPEPERAPALAAARRVLDGLVGGALLERLEEIRHHVVARELPVLLPAGPEDAALETVSGTIDLVYRDPGNGGWVVVDFKTDAVRDERELEARVRSYARQGAVYRRALREGLPLGTDPRLELWFLALDRCLAPGEELRAAPEQLSLTLV
jgi:ATP-dependent exoDNAse (exonuclease V) beta subunit